MLNNAEETEIHNDPKYKKKKKLVTKTVAVKKDYWRIQGPWEFQAEKTFELNQSRLRKQNIMTKFQECAENLKKKKARNSNDVEVYIVEDEFELPL